jgi:aconitate hydratase
MRAGAMENLMLSGATLRTAFCGPCFGAGDVPLNGGLSIRHSTRNFPNREGSKPGEGQLSAVALMDARSIAATARNKGVLTGADEIDYNDSIPEYEYNPEIYSARVYNGYGKPDSNASLKFGPNITDWPEMAPLTDNLLLKIAAYITDPVTTTDELIPSGETSSFRSNPERLAEFALSRKVPSYVPNAKAFREYEKARRANTLSDIDTSEIDSVFKALGLSDNGNTGFGTVVYAYKPGDGSAREQAVSCQKILGTWANIAKEYATKRYLSNLINWGVVPFLYKDELVASEGDYIYIKDIKTAINNKKDEVSAFIVRKDKSVSEIKLGIAPLSDADRQIIDDGCLINNYRR